TRTVALASPLDPVRLQSMTDTLNINSRLYTTSYDASSRTLVKTTPEGRTTALTFDTGGRLIMVQPAGVLPLSITYDERGRTRTLVQGDRISSFNYDGLGRLAVFADPLYSFGFTHDAANRPTGIVRPDLNTLLANWGPGDTLRTVTPPGRQAHLFGYQGS